VLGIESFLLGISLLRVSRFYFIRNLQSGDSLSTAVKFVGLEEEYSIGEAKTLELSETHTERESKSLESWWLLSRPTMLKDNK
jgi:hypothetical protein